MEKILKILLFLPFILSIGLLVPKYSFGAERGQILVAESIEIQKVHPLNWYVGMKNPNLQVLIYGKNIAAAKVSLTKYRGVNLEKVQLVENPNYLFLDLTIDRATKPGVLQFVFEKNGETQKQNFELKNRTANPRGLSAADLVYLIMPDRFANGDPRNDRFLNMTDTICNRREPGLRHGGDLAGIEQKLDYLTDLGVTALWLTPVLTNDQAVSTYQKWTYAAYHGYSFTDHYAVDPRFGGNEAYLRFSENARKRGFKVVQDAVYNHVGSAHWFVRDVPMQSWLHNWSQYTGTSHRNQTLVDPYVSAKEKQLMTDGWFVPAMPDLNQQNPLLATYLIQHAIWSTEYFELDAWRIDTYIYNDLEFMNRCNKALMDEFPNIFMFGESWVGSVLNQAYFVKNNLNLPFKSNQLGGCDFQVFNAMKEALTVKSVYNELGVNKLYQTLAEDFVYQDATRNVIFFENHDTDRFLFTVGGDLRKLKIGITWLLTLRGIPQAYYGSEILMGKSREGSDGNVREDFLGGWQEDASNKFTAAGRTATENEAFNFFRKLAQYRRNSSALTEGKMMQFGPKDGVYTYLRYSEKQRVLVLSNTNDSEKFVSTADFTEILSTGHHAERGSKSGKNILTDEKLNDLSVLKIPALSSMVIEID